MLIAVESGVHERLLRREQEEQKFAAAKARVAAEAAELKQDIGRVAPGRVEGPLAHAAFELCALQPDANGALRFAFEKLRARCRAADLESRIVHALRVTGIVALHFKATERRSVLSALLHDVLEDSDATADEIAERFGQMIAESVELLTKPKRFPKSDRGCAHQQILKSAPEEVVLVKFAEYYDNLQSRRGSPRVSKTLGSARAFCALIAERPELQPRTREALRILEKLLAEIAAEEAGVLAAPERDEKTSAVSSGSRDFDDLRL